MCNSIYIYIPRHVTSSTLIFGRRGVESRSVCFRIGRLFCKHRYHILAQDKGGPSKGGFLNNILCSYTDICLCNEIHGVCTNNRLLRKIIEYSGNHLY